MILAGDIGGTHARLACFSAAGERLAFRSFRSADFAGLPEILETFFEQGDPAAVTDACLGIAGPVFDNRCHAPNLAWKVDGGEIARRFDFGRCRLINDLVATAEGLADLAPAELSVLQPGDRRPEGCRLLIAAGTGLGLALLPPADSPGRQQILPSEVGHADFAARTDEEIELLRFLRRRHGRVGIERVVSGPGIVAIWEHLSQRHRREVAPSLGQRLTTPKVDIAAEIARAAGSGECPVAERTVNLFLGAFGALVGSLALTVLATGGVYLAGGIPTKLIPALSKPTFLEAWRAKGRFSDFVRGLPLTVVRAEDTALRGAARIAMQ
ncbi:MAG: glucokinase [Acidobacteriota bacterium]